VVYSPVCIADGPRRRGRRCRHPCCYRTSVPLQVESLKKTLEGPIEKVVARAKALLAAAEERQLVRAEIEHYK
jgi:hypothetical protein